MRKITIYDVNEEVYFLRRTNKKATVSKTDFQFLCPCKGTIIAALNTFVDGYYTIKSRGRGSRVYEVTYKNVFASKEEAGLKANDLNKKINSKIREEINNIEKNYLGIS